MKAIIHLLTFSWSTSIEDLQIFAMKSNLQFQNGTIQKEFLMACKNANTEKVARILDRNKITPKQLTKMCMLHKATRWCDVELVKRLLNFGASPNVRNSGNYTPLLLAAATGELEIVKELLKFGAKVNVLDSKDWTGRTPLFYAAKDGHFEIVRELLKKGARVDLDEGADILKIQFFKKTPIARKIANELIKSRPRMFTDFLHDAVFYDDVDFVKQTLESGNTKTINSRGGLYTLDGCSNATPLEIAIKRGNQEMVKILQDHGAVEVGDVVDPFEFLECLRKVKAFAKSRGVSDTDSTLQELTILAFRMEKK